MEISMKDPFVMEKGQKAGQIENMLRIEAINSRTTHILCDQKESMARESAFIAEENSLRCGDLFFFEPFQDSPFSCDSPGEECKAMLVFFSGNRTVFKKKIPERSLDNIDFPTKTFGYKKDL
jgi:hypothetical protein